MPPKLPERLESPQPPSSPARKISTGGQVTVQQAADEDEFGYGLVSISDTPKPALPKTLKASPPAPPTESGKTSLMDTVSLTNYVAGMDVAKMSKTSGPAPLSLWTTPFSQLLFLRVCVLNPKCSLILFNNSLFFFFSFFFLLVG